MLAACADHTFEGKTATALVRRFFNTVARRDETVNLRRSPTYRDVVLNRGTVRLFSKGSLERFARIADHAVDSL